MKLAARLGTLVCVLLATLTSACGSKQANAYDDYDEGIAEVAGAMASILATRPGRSVAIPPLRRTDGSITELGRLVAQDLMIDFETSTGRVQVCDRNAMEEILREFELQREGLIDAEGAHQLGRFCGADTLLLGTLFRERNGVTVRLNLIDTETAERLAGRRFWVPLTPEKEEALATQTSPPPDSKTRKRHLDENLPQSHRVGDFAFKLTSCTFLAHDGLFCYLQVRNEQGTARTLEIRPSSLLTDNQGARYPVHEVTQADRRVTLSKNGAPMRLEIPAGTTRAVTVRFVEISRHERKARLLEIHTADGEARFGDFFFDRDEL